jgi:CRISPR-associated protein Cas2
MASARHLILITYDVSDDRDRRKLSTFLEEHMTRVQGSVFEGWMTRREARKIARLGSALAGESESIRLYIIPRGGISACEAWGFPPAPCPDGALIL